MGSYSAQIVMGIVLCGFISVSSASAKDQFRNIGRRLPIIDVTDRVFVAISAGTEMSHASVGQILDDEQGFLWFATRAGLVRYDGYQVTQYLPYSGPAGSALSSECCPSVSLVTGMVRYSLFRGHSGKEIWIGGDESLHQYDSETGQVRQLQFAPRELQGFVRNVNQDRAGSIWLATSRGLIRYDPMTGHRTLFLHSDGDESTLSSNQVRATLEARDGTFWVATNASLDILNRQTGRVAKHLSLRNPLQKPSSIGNPYVRLLEDSSGTIWIASARDGLAFVDPLHGNLTFLGLSTGSDSEPGAWAILEDRSGELWVGTELGLLRLDHDRRKFARYRKNPADPTALPADWVIAIFEDQEDGIWVGTANAGVARFSEFSLPFQRYRRQEAGGRAGPDYIFAAYEDNNGAVWAGGKGAIYRIDLTTGRYTQYPIPEDTEVVAIAQDRSGQFWIGTNDGSLFRLNPATLEWTTYAHNATNSQGCGNNEVRAFHVDRFGTLWAGANEGLCSIDTATGRFRLYRATDPSLNQINAIDEDAAGRFWIGSAHAGLQRFDPTTGQFTFFRHSDAPGGLSSDNVMSILVDRSGIIWVGTTEGLNRLDSTTGQFTVYREEDGLPGKIVNGVVQDQIGDLWITTSYGLSHFHPRSRTFTNYYRSDGVLDDLTGAWKGRSGRMFFGSYSGLTALTAGAVNEKTQTPRVVLTNLLIADKSLTVGPDSLLKQSISIAKALTLSHSQNILSFEFAALSYSDPERTRYRYRLGGLEREWNEVPSTEHFVRYSNLAPGDYTFEVQARTGRGSWTEKGAELHVTILPPFWATWQFRAVCALLLLASLWYAHQYRLEHLSRQLKLRYEERLAERTRIAQELHDTLLQGFLSASMHVHVAATAVPADSEAKTLLKRALGLMNQVIEEGRNAVRGLRSSSSKSLDLERALAKIPEELGPAFQEGIEFRLIVDGEPRTLHPLLRDDVYRIGREALVNAFRHAHAKHIDVELKYSRKEFEIVIRDDGNGMDSVVAEKGRAGHWGLLGMRERADRIGARLHVYSRPSAGTEIELSIPGNLAFLSGGADQNRSS